MKIILASGSPRRSELLTQIGIAFEVMVSDAPEECSADNPAELVQKLSCEKADAVCRRIINDRAQEDFIVIGADTVASYKGKILGKPRSEREAGEFLALLQGNTHEVCTGVTLLRHIGGRDDIMKKTFCEETRVHFAEMSEEEIEEYVSTGDCMDKAGAYGIQGFCARYIKGIDGDYNNVVGLPAAHLYAEIREWL